MAGRPEDLHERPRATERDRTLWRIGLAPETITIDGETRPHPARTSAIFVVHGMGQPAWTHTAAALRSGFEDALEVIAAWQQKQPGLEGRVAELGARHFPCPFILDGHWGDYPDLQKTFPEDWGRFSHTEEEFFSQVWRIRTVSAKRTFAWFVQQQVRLLSPRVLVETGPLAYFLYVPLQPVALLTLLAFLVIKPRVLTKYLADVRLYLDPRGTTERAIVQNIDYRVGRDMLSMLGLGWDFRPLPPERALRVAGEPMVFERLVWVSHSLGTVISYNVFSDLVDRAERLLREGDAQEQAGAKRFCTSLKQFVTLGSPLDKVAFLYPGALRPWGDRLQRVRRSLGAPERDDNWWVNFYHVLDPVSGSLANRQLTEHDAIQNLHGSLNQWPGWAHVGYWRDGRVLRFILGRVFGPRVLRDKVFCAYPAALRAVLIVLGYLVYLVLVLALAAAPVAGVVWVVTSLGH